MKLLVIEDEQDLRNTILHFFQQEKYLVEVARDYEEALEKLYLYAYDCIILDINLPGGSGLDLLTKMQASQVAYNVIITSARNSLDDKIVGLDLGADDYLTKPFHLAELNARVKAILRRKQLSGSQLLQLNNLRVDFESREAFVEGTNLTLNRKEFDVLSFFLLNQNKLIHKTALAEHVWGDHTDTADSFDFIYSQIKNLRKKFKDSQAQLEIQAVYGIGYKLIVH
ncbi:response regulator transcription factor [Sphingobacteriaceae bacterium WQ 2009]|uniref:Response regulator transcription factor n=1 Tax=Rhinopithecimicrobium faecis TaxID=2820698 RepID=A0A8T4HBF0_9SPHI|nr:response regulator transcription factor [Sphingobacteriaceae bacterium WQ 2009]